MKKHLFTLLLIVFALSITQAQSIERPHSISVKKIWLDHHSPTQDGMADLDKFTHGFEVAYLNTLNRYFNISFPLKAGVLNIPEEINNTKFIGVDAVGQFMYYQEENPVTPYFMLGIGGVLEDFDQLDFQIPVGLGVNFKLGQFGFINLQAEYRRSLDFNHHNVQYGVGLGITLGKITEEELLTIPAGDMIVPDRDNDGVPDEKDNCPDTKGLVAMNGCPDQDGDTVIDSLDMCPQDFGSVAAKGCPDTDNDGFANNVDKCPDLAGTVDGCPDSDGDGIVDTKDKCPEKAGVASAGGCPQIDTDNDGTDDSLDQCPGIPGPILGCPDSDGDKIADKDDRCPFAAGEGRFNGCPDTDGDGIDDSRDACPSMAAPASPNGCPTIEKKDRELLDYAIQAVQFEYASSQLKRESYPILDQVADIMMRYPDYYLKVVGHTDNTGNEKRNNALAVARAESCQIYLVEKGIDSRRMSTGGFGSTEPVADNASDEGRALNRRVEFILEPKSK